MNRKIIVTLILFFTYNIKFIKALSLTEILPSGYEILDSVSGDLNKDEYKDMIIILKHNHEDSLSRNSEYAIKRETLILLGTENGYTINARNSNAVYCANCGGPMGDPFVGVSIQNGSFSIQHYGGGVWRWGRVSTFTQNSPGKWVLSKDENETFSTENPEATKEKIITTPKEFGVITFEQYDIDKE